MKEMRYIIRIQQLNNSMLTIDCAENETILSAMVRQNVQYHSDCGGRGTCGKCKLQVIGGKLDVTIQDRKIFTEEELHVGYRLSCKAYPCEDLTIKLLSGDETGMEVVTENCINLSEPTSKMEGKIDNYVIGIDLGTTTLAIGLINTASKEMIRTYSAINPQRAYGADVVSRMKASNEGKGDQLRDFIRKSLLEGIQSVIREAGIDVSNIEKIAIAGNTTMGHLLMGYSCETLGVFPFTPVNIATIEVKFKDIFSIELFKDDRLSEYNYTEDADDCSEHNNSFNIISFENVEKLHVAKELEDENLLQEVPVIILPGISTFVGGDIVAGLSVCGFDAAKKPCLLIDLGTNGEMALGNREHILVTSTAAGPAFEGGNISCGVGSIPGAISHIIINGEEIIYETIGNKPPVGICGTGVVEIVSELFKANLVDETGLLVEEYFKEGFPITERQTEATENQQKVTENQQKSLRQYDKNENKIIFTQKDIREFQLAKAAVRAGIEVLVKSYGITLQQIDKVYLAGGFGYKIDVEKAIHIGLIPEELRGKILVIGNSSLAGAVEYLTEPSSEEKVERILSISKEIHLSNDDDFYDLYLKHMSFEKNDSYFK